MRAYLLAGAGVALLTGIAVGVQATLTSRAGELLGELRTGLLTNLAAGILAALVMIPLVLHQGSEAWRPPLVGAWMVTGAGLLGILIITGAAFSFPRTGVAAGVAAVILGQLVISVLADTSGVGGVEPIPLTAERVAGLLLMGVAVYLLLPRG